MSNDYFKAQGWFKNYATSSEDSRGVFQELVKEDEEAFRLANAETDKIKAMMNEKYGPGTIKYGSEIKQPEIKTPQAAFEFSQRNPAAEGGRMRFDEGLSAKQKKALKITYPKSNKDLKFTTGSGPGTGSALEANRNTKIVKSALNKIKKQINNKSYFEWSEKSDWYKKLQKNLGGKAEGLGMNRDYTNQLINKVVKENFSGSYHGKNAIKNLRQDVVVNSFVEYLKDNGEFDGGEKFLKSLEKFEGKDIDHKYERINSSWKSWIAGDFEVEGVDRAQLKKELKARGIDYSKIDSWSASSSQKRGLNKKSAIEFLDNQNNKFANRSFEQVEKLYKEKFPNRNIYMDVNTLTDIKRTGIYKSGDSTTSNYKSVKKGDRANWLKESYGKQFQGNYSKLIKAADQLEAAGEFKKAKRVSDAADKFFGPNGIITNAKGEGEHALARTFDLLNPDRQLAINSLISGDLNQFKKNFFDIPVKRYFDEYNNPETTSARRKELKTLIEGRKSTLNSLTGGQTKGIVAGDIVKFQYTPDKIVATSNVEAIDTLFKEGKFDIDAYIAKGTAYGDAFKVAGKEANIFTKTGDIKKTYSSPINESKLKEIESYITDRTGNVKKPFIGLSSGFNTDLIAEDLKKIMDTEGFKTFKANIADPALEAAGKAVKVGSKVAALPTKVFGGLDVVFGYFDYLNNKQKGYSDEDAIKHMIDATLINTTSFGEKADIEGVRKIANKNNMSNEVFDNLMAVNTNQKKFMDTVSKSKAKFNESMDIIESGAADPTAENMLIQKLKVDTKESLTNTMKNIVKDSRSLETNLQVQEAGAPININVDKEKAFSDLGSSSREFVQTRIDASDPKVFEQGDSTMGKIGNIFDKTLLDKEFMTKLAVGDYLGLADTKAIRNQKGRQKLKQEDPTLYYKMLQSKGIDPRINLNIPVQLEFEQKFPQFGNQMSNKLTQNKAEGGITGLRSKYEYKK